MGGTTAFIEALEDESIGRGQFDIFQGWAYSTGAVFEDVSSGSSDNVWLKNPSDSGNFVVVFSRFSVSGEFFVRKKDNVTKDSDGTSLTINNRLLSNGSSSASAQKSISHSGGNDWNEKVLGAGSNSAANITSAIGGEPELVLEEGDNLILIAQNKTAGSLDMSIDIDFFEVPLTEVDEI